MKKNLTDKQQKFLDILFGEAEGDPQKAMELAGYVSSRFHDLLESLHDEIIHKAEQFIAMHAPAAAMGLTGILLGTDDKPNTNARMEAARQILDRAGIVKKDKMDINIDSEKGIFIFPAKAPE
jgi:hypothetical protein